MSYVVFGRKLTNSTVNGISTPLPTTQLTTSTALTSMSSQSVPIGQSTTITSPTTSVVYPLTNPPISARQETSSIAPSSVSFTSASILNSTRSTSTMMKLSFQPPTTSSPPVSTSSTINVPLIAGIAGGAGALTLSIIAGVVAFLRKRSKNRNKNLEGATPLPTLQVNENAKGEIAKPVSQLYAGFGQVNQVNYDSARFNQQESHYSDPNEWAKELQNNPPQPNYVNVNSLEVHTGENYSRISRVGYDDIPAPAQANT